MFYLNLKLLDQAIRECHSRGPEATVDQVRTWLRSRGIEEPTAGVVDVATAFGPVKKA